MDRSNETEIVASYSLNKSASVGGMIAFAIFPLAALGLAVNGFIRSNSITAGGGLIIAIVTGAVLHRIIKTFAANIRYDLVQDAVIETKNGLVTRHALTDIVSIKMSHLGDGGYKATFRDGTVFWFALHSSEAVHFARELAKFSGRKLP